MGHFTVEQLRSIRKVISHGNNCPDGIASAMVVIDAYRRALLPLPELFFVDHNSEAKANLAPEPGMMFLDFSPDPEKAQGFIDAKAICLDHHAKGSSVQAFVAAGLGVFGDENKDPGVCGAVLAYEHVWKVLRGGQGEAGQLLDAAPLLVQEFARLSGIRDTWQKNSPDWTLACEMAEALRFWPIESLLKLDPEDWQPFLSLGTLLWSRKLKTVAKVAERVYRWTSPKGTRAAFFQGVKLSSDVAEAIGANTDLIIAYDIGYEDGELKLICSSRSRGAYDCGSLALARGGGGHTRAAGFSLPMTIDSPNPYRMLQETVTAHEGQ